MAPAKEHIKQRIVHKSSRGIEAGKMSYEDRRQLSELIGKTLTSAVNVDNEAVQFTTDSDQTFKLYHSQDCCESVYLEDVVGDLDDLVGSPIVVAEEVSESPEPGPLREHEDSFTWTFYKFATIKGSVTLRWYGSSNGYYSEGVDFEEVT